MSKKYDLAVKVGEYQKDGETKSRYENVGSVMQGDNGFYMILKRTFNPAGVPNPEDRDSVIVSMFEPRNQQQGGQSSQYGNSAPQQSQAAPASDDPFGDSVPF